VKENLQSESVKTADDPQVYTLEKMAFRVLPLPASQRHLYMKLAEKSFADGIMSLMYVSDSPS
jgi:hypothetical protein